MNFQPDDTDRLIIKHLREENVTNSNLARELGCSEGTIRQRLKRLKEAGVLKVTAQINPDALDQRQVAIVAINVQKVALLEKKAQEVTALSEVVSVSIVSGRYDLMAEVLVDSNHGLVAFLTESLSTVEGITNSESFLLLKSYGKFV